VALIVPFFGKAPKIAPGAFVAPNAALIGDVEIAEGASIWYGCVLRADHQPVRVGRNTNIQDGTVVHIDSMRYGTTIGSNILIGHLALIHACTLEDECYIGMKACVMDRAVVESGAMVAAGAVVTPGKRVKSGEIWAGSPAKYWRDFTDADRKLFSTMTQGYTLLAQQNREACRAAGLGETVAKAAE
jgi:carbonic anhydrase/acetyltransferase-like protein (isoleucine patch superfamily)